MNDLRQAAQQALEACEQRLPLNGQAAIIDELNNLRAALAEPVQEPVLVVEKEPDYWNRGHFHQGSKPHIDPTKVWGLPIGTKLYTAPPQPKPLTDELLQTLHHEDEFGLFCDYNEFEQIARAIEAAHGIKENT